MSHSVTKWAYDVTGPSGVAKAVLHYLAWCSNEDGADARPSVGRICKRTGHHEAAIRRGIRELIEGGLLEVISETAPSGRQTSNQYVLAVGRMFTPTPAKSRGSPPLRNRGGHPCEIERVTPAISRETLPINNIIPEEGDTSVSPTGARETVDEAWSPNLFGDASDEQTPIAVVEPDAPPSDVPPPRAKQRNLGLGRRSLAQRQQDDTALAMFMAIYPRCDDPDAIKREFNKRLRQGVPAITLLTAARMYADRVVPTLSSPEFIKKAHNWLHDATWKNAPPEEYSLADRLARIVGLTPEEAQRAQPQSQPQQKHMLLAIDGERAA